MFVPQFSSVIGWGCSQGAIICQHTQQLGKGLRHHQMGQMDLCRLKRAEAHAEADGGCCDPCPPKLGTILYVEKQARALEIGAIPDR